MFIVLEGIDGSGKGEMKTRLVAYLRGKGYDVLDTAEPTSGQYGKKIREMLKSGVDPHEHATEFLDLFVKDRDEHLKLTVEPHLAKEGFVVSDRYYYSTIAYQHVQGLSFEVVIDKNKSFIKPDLMILLDLPVDVALSRVDVRGEGKEVFEKKEFLEKLRQAYLDLREKLEDNIVVIDASVSKEDVFESIKKEVDKFLV